METTPLKLSGLMLFKPRVFHDARGFFLETYRKSAYALPEFVQDNLSFSKKNVIRALHFQSHPGQAKLVSCLQGTIFDVAVDIRPDSPTFKRWIGVELRGDTHEQLFVPAGFAHGYCVLSNEATVQYKVSAPYDPTTERSIRWNDPQIGVEWPVTHPVLSPRDEQSPFFNEVFYDVVDHRR
ncbi:MAG TPA: dTDP-4-dehydrorhamnose 3,5-epimerase [Chlamydiales bacterium]|jgi:dTDP-4-dehydrorhamnose 3,5-epimerase